MDPHTGIFTDRFRTREERTHTEGAHMLWALRRSTDAEVLRCREPEHTLRDWVGESQPANVGSVWTHQWSQTMTALRTIIWTVQYLDAGLDLQAEQKWLELGISPTTRSWILAHMDAFGSGLQPDSEEILLADLTALTSRHGRLRRQQKTATQEVVRAIADSRLRALAPRADWPSQQVRP